MARKQLLGDCSSRQGGDRSPSEIESQKAPATVKILPTVAFAFKLRRVTEMQRFNSDVNTIQGLFLQEVQGQSVA